MDSVSEQVKAAKIARSGTILAAILAALAGVIYLYISPSSKDATHPTFKVEINSSNELNHVNKETLDISSNIENQTHEANLSLISELESLRTSLEDMSAVIDKQNTQIQQQNLIIENLKAQLSRIPFKTNNSGEVIKDKNTQIDISAPQKRNITNHPCIHSYTLDSDGWQNKKHKEGDYFAQVEDRRYKNQGLKAKLNRIQGNDICTIAEEQDIHLSNWDGATLPPPINFSEYFSDCDFGPVYNPKDSNGQYLDIAAATAKCPENY